MENNSLETVEIDCPEREDIDGIEDLDNFPKRGGENNEKKAANEISTETNMKTDRGEEFDKIAIDIEKIDDFRNEEWSSMEISTDSSGASSTGTYCI